MTTNLAEHDTTTDSVTGTPDVAATAGTAPEDTVYPYIKREVDPTTLRVTGNSRVVGDIRENRPDLVASIAKHGVDPRVSIINVAPNPEDGVLEVQVGFHRTAAAVAVKELENPDLLIPVLVHAPGTTRELLIAQGTENIHREGYTESEEAGLFKQLALEGLGDEEIAENLSRPVERVRAGLAVAASSRTRAASEALPDTDLLLLAELAEFGDNEQDHEELVDVLANRPFDFSYRVNQVRKRRERRAKQSAEAQRLTEQGFAIVEDEDALPVGAARLDELCTGEDETPLDPAAHADCPGRAVSVDVNPWMEVDVTEFCTDYEAQGHHTIASVRIAAAEAQLQANGVPIVDPEAEAEAVGDDDVVEFELLSDLFADEKAERTLTAEEHAGCPGHAAYIEADPYRSTVDVVYVCTDHVAHGHVRRATMAAPPARDAAFEAAERKRAKENNKLWREEAKAARRDWLDGHFTGWRRYKPAPTSKRKGKAPAPVPMLPPRVHHWLALAPVLARDFLYEAAPTHHYACRLLKLAEPEGHQRDRNPIAVALRKKTTTQTQAELIALAQVVGACEEHFDRAYTDKNADSSWRRPSDDTKYYFELLEALGYPLTHVEQLINNPDLDKEHWPHLADDTESVNDTESADVTADDAVDTDAEDSEDAAPVA